MLGIGASLSGCIAAAVPVMMAASVGVGGLSGFEVFKIVQLSSGGAVHVEFPGKDGKTQPPTPLPPVRKVAVWPEGKGDVMFADRLVATNRLTVAPPATVSAVLAETHTPAVLNQLTEQEKRAAFDMICRRAKTELIFASLPLGTSSDQNSWSFARATITLKYEILAYSCTRHAVVSDDQIAAVIEVGDKTPSGAEINKIMADAWADRVLQAMSGSAQITRQ